MIKKKFKLIMKKKAKEKFQWKKRTKQTKKKIKEDNKHTNNPIFK